MFYPNNGPLGSDLSWGMFMLSGNPAYYMLYKGIMNSDVIDGQEPLTEEERQRR